MQPDEPQDLDWLAFRYVAGELDPAEAAAFELRLADDQLARDAVCRAVALAGRMATAAPQEAESSAEIATAPSPAAASPAATARRYPLLSAVRAAGWMAAGAAATLLGVYLSQPFASSPGASSPSGRASPEAKQAVQPATDALVWARLNGASQWAGEQVDAPLPPLEAPQAESLELQPPYTLSNWSSAAQSLRRGKP
jgi:hypothetical protein